MVGQIWPAGGMVFQLLIYIMAYSSEKLKYLEDSIMEKD